MSGNEIKLGIFDITGRLDPNSVNQNENFNSTDLKETKYDNGKNDLF